MADHSVSPYLPTTEPVQKAGYFKLSPRTSRQKPIGLCYWLFVVFVLTLLVISLILTPIFYIIFVKIDKLEHALIEDNSHRSLLLDSIRVHHTVGDNAGHVAASADVDGESGDEDEDTEDDYDEDVVALYKHVLDIATSDVTTDKLSIRHKRAANDRKRKSRKSNKLKNIQKEIKQIKSKLVDLEKHKPAISRFTAELDPQVAEITRSNENLNTFYGKVEGGAVLPTPGQRYRFWQQSSDTDTNKFSFNKESGTVTVKHAGTYLIYAQVLYHDGGPRTAYAIRASPSALGDPSILVKCLATAATLPVADSPEDATAQALAHEQYHMCSTVTVLKLNANQVLDMFPLYVGQLVVPDGAATFWGVVKLG